MEMTKTIVKTLSFQDNLIQIRHATNYIKIYIYIFSSMTVVQFFQSVITFLQNAI